MVRIRRQLAAEFARANVGRILNSQQVLVECFGWNCQREFARVTRNFPHAEGVLADQRLHLIAEKLHDDFVAHLGPATKPGRGAAPTTFLIFLARRRLGGVPSAASTTMMLVTNFFMPWRSKSMEVRSELDSVTTPRPY